MRVISFTVQVGGIRETIKNVEDLNNVLDSVRKSLKTAEFGTQGYKDLQGVLGQLTQVQKELSGETRIQQREFVKAAEAGKGS